MTHPFDDPRSREADDLAAKGDLAARHGEFERARRLMLEAATMERELAISTVGEVPKVRSVFAVNAVQLCTRARDYDRAVQYAEEFLAKPTLFHVEGRDELRQLADAARRAGTSGAWRRGVRAPFLPRARAAA